MERIYSIYGKIIFVPAHIGLDEGEVTREVDGTNAFNVSRDIDNCSIVLYWPGLG